MTRLRRSHAAGTVPRMRIARTFALAFAMAALSLAGCASAPVAPRDDSVATYLLVRHAEKDTRVADDPPLTDAGLARAERLAAGLRGTRLDAIYSSPYRRTRQTAAPVARERGLPVLEYAPGDAAAFAARLRAERPRGTVLVVGHSNTLPPLARQLCRCEVADMDEAVYGIRYTIRIDATGRAHLAESRD